LTSALWFIFPLKTPMAINTPPTDMTAAIIENIIV